MSSPDPIPVINERADRDPTSTRGRIVLDDSVEIALPVEEVFAYLLDVEKDPLWQDGLVEARYTSDGPVGVGTTGQHTAKPMGLTIEVGWQLIDVETPERIAWRFTSGPFTGHEGYALEPIPTGTRLSHVAELRPHGVLWLLRPLIAGMWARQSEQALHRLKGLLEDG